MVSVNQSEDTTEVVFRKWDNPLGTTLIKPEQLREMRDGTPLRFLASNYKIGTLNRLDIQILSEG